tara:strand:+ start:544 stop:1278 length:735 start_codon:yes stop_codon:yes gene_type:complete
MKNVILIPSRMASTRFPGKPLVKINGIPMIQRVWQQAITSDVGDVYVACSEVEVFELITSLGGKAIMTDPKLQSGTDRVYSAYQQIDKNSEIDYLINLQGDMPIINPNDIKKVVEPLKNDYSLGTLVTQLKANERENPNITKVIVDWKEKNVGEAKDFFRDNNDLANNVFHHVGIYSYSVDAIKKFVSLPKSKNEISLNLEQYRAMDAGLKIGVTYVPDIAPSVDTKEDLITVESIIKENNENN